MYVHTRYELPDENGVTRRERNASVDIYSPAFDIPDGGEYLWQAYHEISDSITRVYDGVCWPMTPSEIDAWSRMSGAELNPAEFGILLAMDVAFCSEMNKELQAYFKRSQKPISGE